MGAQSGSRRRAPSHHRVLPEKARMRLHCFICATVAFPDDLEADLKHNGRACFSMAKDPKCFVCRKGVFDGLSQEIRAACDLNFLGKEISHLLVRGELDKQGFHCITPDWTQVSKDPPLWANEYFEMIPGVHPNANILRRMPALDDYGVSGYK